MYLLRMSFLCGNPVYHDTASALSLLWVWIWLQGSKFLMHLSLSDLDAKMPCHCAAHCPQRSKLQLRPTITEATLLLLYALPPGS